MILVVAGHPSVDRVYEVNELQPGAIHRPAPPIAVPGGKGLNVARAARTLGADVWVLTILAGYSGHWIAHELKAAGIEGTYVWSDGETRMSISIADRSKPTAPMTEFYENSHPIDASAWLELEDRAQDAFRHSALLCLSGSLITGAPTDGYRRLAELAHRSGVPVALDSHGEYLLHGLRAGPDLVKVNASEAGTALDAPLPDHGLLSWAADAAMALRAHVESETACVVTAGIQGMALADPDDKTYCGHVDHLGEFPVGSGDAALAALAIAMSGGSAWPDALTAALGAAGANATTPGPGILDPERAEALRARAVVEQVDL